MTKTNGDILKAHADKIGMPTRTLEQVRAGLAQAKRTNADRELALLMFRHGRLTDEARAYVASYLEA